MVISFLLKDSLYNCDLNITDSNGTRIYSLNAPDDSNPQNHIINIDVADPNFDITVIPTPADYKSALNDLENETFKDIVANNLIDKLISAFENMFLRIGCRYHIENVQDGDIIEIHMQQYIFGTFDKYGVWELIPMAYMFYEISCFGSKVQLTNTFETNKRSIINAAKRLSLAEGFGNGIFLTLLTYPIQVGRVKYISSNKKIFKTLRKFHNMSPDERQKLLDKFEQFIN